MFGPHVVALMDFLGQSEALSEWDFSPASSSDMDQFLHAAKKTFGRVKIWRGKFEKCLQSFVNEKANTVTERIDRLPDKGQAFRRFQDVSLGFSHFSDTIIVYFPIVNRHGFEDVANVTGTIVTCGVLLLEALAHKQTPFRGGIEIGMAARFPEADLYGPALAKAHYLENKVAQYPRIVAGEQLCAYLAKHARSSERSPQADANREIAQMSVPLLKQDDDGQWIVDFLGQGFSDVTGKPDQLRKLQEPARQFVRQERERFLRTGKKHLAERYDRLASYFETGMGSACPGSEGTS